MSLHAKILALDDGQRTTSQIAAMVGCRKEYVRSCRQRRSAGQGQRKRKRKPPSAWIRRCAAAFLEWRRERVGL